MTTAVLYGSMLSVAPSGTAVENARITQNLDGDPPMQEIGRWYASAIQNDTNGIYGDDKIEFDTKAMRKLRTGDTILWHHIASTANDLRARGIIYLWFKE